MRLARRTAPEARPALVGVVDYTLTASPGAEQSWAEMYSRLYPRLCDSAERLLGYDAARDAVHEAMDELWHRWPKLSPDERTDAFVFRAVKFRVIDQLRRDQRHVELTEELEESGEIELVSEPTAGRDIDVAEQVDRIVAAMPLRCREVYVLVHEQGLTGREAAVTLGVAFETVRTHMKRVNLILRESLKRAVANLEAGEAMKLLPPNASEEQ